MIFSRTILGILSCAILAAGVYYCVGGSADKVDGPSGVTQESLRKLTGEEKTELIRALDALKSKDDVEFHKKIRCLILSGSKVSDKDYIRYLLIDSWAENGNPFEENKARILAKPLPLVLDVISEVLQGESCWTQAQAIKVLVELSKSDQLNSHNFKRMTALVSSLVRRASDCTPYAGPADLFLLQVDNPPYFVKEAVKDKVFGKDPGATMLFLSLSAEMENKDAIGKMIDYYDTTQGWFRYSLMQVTWQNVTTAEVPREKWQQWWQTNCEKPTWRWRADAIENMVDDFKQSKENAIPDLVSLSGLAARESDSGRFLVLGKYLVDSAGGADERNRRMYLRALADLLAIDGDRGYPREVMGDPNDHAITNEQMDQWKTLWQNYATLFLAGGTTGLTEVESRKVAELITQLGDKNFDTRETAQVSLIQIGARAYDMLKEHSEDPDLEIQARVQTLLSQVERLVLHVRNDPRLYCIPQILVFLLVDDYRDIAAKRLHDLTDEDFGANYDKWVSWYEENESFLRFDYSTRMYHIVPDAKRVGVNQRAWECIPDAVKSDWDKLDANTRESAVRDAWHMYEQEEYIAWYNGISLDAWRQIPESKRSDWQNISDQEKQTLISDAEQKLGKHEKN